MSLLSDTCAAIQPVDQEVARQTQKLLDEKTKPPGSLGMLETLACRLAAITGKVVPPFPRKAVVVMAADHGVTEEGVSQYPAEVTAQMLRNFAAGGAAINVLARQANAEVVVVDMGTRGESPTPQRSVLGLCTWIGPGTANMTRGPAMTTDQEEQAITVGIQLAAKWCAAGVGLIGLGDMGIGNTTAASALAAVFTGEAVRNVTGRGTGISDAALQRKIRVIEKALAVNQPTRQETLNVLHKIGGFELAGLAGVILGAAQRRIPILLDGFITTAAALPVVERIPHVRDYLIASHQSAEPGHRIILEHLKLRPLLKLDLRLGEGTGAVLAMHLVEAALGILHEMATFNSAGVSKAEA